MLQGLNQALTISVLFNPSQNVGVHYERWNTGVLGPVTLKGLNEGTRDLTKQKWSYKVCVVLSIQLLPCSPDDIYNFRSHALK